MNDSCKKVERWHSPRLDADITLARWGHFGEPVLFFPTAGGDAEEIERHHLVESVRPLIEAGRIKLYCPDSINGRALLEKQTPRAHCAWLLDRYASCMVHEVLPAIVADSGGHESPVIAAGCSIGAYNAVSLACRFPEQVRVAIGMSGTYDLERFMEGHVDQHFYLNSPMHWLPQHPGSHQLDRLRQRFIMMAFAGGKWEDPQESWRMAEVLGSRGVPNRVDAWGTEYDHDWPTWRAMLPRYLDEFAAHAP